MTRGSPAGQVGAGSLRQARKLVARPAQGTRKLRTLNAQRVALLHVQRFLSKRSAAEMIKGAHHVLRASGARVGTRVTFKVPAQLTVLLDIEEHLSQRASNAQNVGTKPPLGAMMLPYEIHTFPPGNSFVPDCTR